MDGVIKTSLLPHTSSIYKKEIGEGQNPKRGKIIFHKREESGDQVFPPKCEAMISDSCSNVEADP